MRWRMIVLGLLLLASVALVWAVAQQSAQLQLQAESVFERSPTASQAEQQQAQVTAVTASELQLLVPAAGASALVCATGLLVVAARRWELTHRGASDG